MEKFRDGHRVRLRNRVRGTYLRADDEGSGISLSPRGASRDDAAWEVRVVVRDGFNYLLLCVPGTLRFLAVSWRGHRGERRVVQADGRFCGETLWTATRAGRSTRERRFVVLRHAFFGPTCLRADGRVAGVSMDDLRYQDCQMMHWEVERVSDEPAPPPPRRCPAVWAPVFRVGEADGGLSSSWIPLLVPRRGVVAHVPGKLVGSGAARLLGDGRGHLEVDAASLAAVTAWDREGGLLIVVPQDVARLAAARRLLASGAAFRGAQRALWPRAAALLPLRLVGGGNAPAVLGQVQEAADAAARARPPEEEQARRVADPPAAVHPAAPPRHVADPPAVVRPAAADVYPGPRRAPPAPRPQQKAEGTGRKSKRKEKNAQFAYKPEEEEEEEEEPAGGGQDGDHDPLSSVNLLLSHLSSLENGMIRRQAVVQDRLRQLVDLEIRRQRGAGEDEVPSKDDIRNVQDVILTTVDSYTVMSAMAEDARRQISEKGGTPPRRRPALAVSPEAMLPSPLLLRLQQRRRDKEQKKGNGQSPTHT